jgi:bacterioferritin (cytochrome b1)
MTVQSDLKKAIAAAESAKGSYATFAESTEDQMAKAMFQQMSQDMENHIQQLNGRLTYLTESNPMNQGQQQQ